MGLSFLALNSKFQFFPEEKNRGFSIVCFKITGFCDCLFSKLSVWAIVNFKKNRYFASFSTTPTIQAQFEGFILPKKLFFFCNVQACVESILASSLKKR